MDLLSLIESAILGIVFVGLGLILGIIGWRQKNYRMMYGGFGHFIGTVVSFALAYMANEQEAGNGTAIIILYPLFVGIGIFVGVKMGTGRERSVRK
jgi:ABC-type Mn2+/Zn2+ transport system permease subunit